MSVIAQFFCKRKRKFYFTFVKMFPLCESGILQQQYHKEERQRFMIVQNIKLILVCKEKLINIFKHKNTGCIRKCPHPLNFLLFD